MSNSENKKDYFIVSRESYWSEEAGEVKTRRVKVPTDREFYYEWYRPIWAQRKRAQTHGECLCPQSELWKCDGGCEECEFRGAGEMLSLDYSYTDKKGNEVRPVDNLEDEREDILSILEDCEELSCLYQMLEELDPEGRRICELIMAGKSERSISTLLGMPRNTYVYRQNKLFKRLQEQLQDYR